ncbi:RNA-binding domain-containing protein [Hesseltinella vesiculosa]|uniref:RNA-binding domain-containing protein n=1 Tax=Hesseltinella vesiculosa TaxID=101127 RepID=A0A1X2GLQ3_9FUNG|nr:RNA-binding domain-containing protein [Hesseltinella vesiculosa]
MAGKKKATVAKKQDKKPEPASKKVTFSGKKEVTTFEKNSIVRKRKNPDQDDQSAKKKALKQAPVVEDVEDSSDEDNVANDIELDALSEEQEEALRKEILGDLVESDDDEDSSDDEAADHIEINENIVSLSKKAIKAQPKSVATAAADESGIVYVGRIPKSFVEADIVRYFKQFGEIKKIRISKNKKGQSRHYGFIQFASKEVAEIVAETMNNYLVDGRLIQCNVVPESQQHEKLFASQKKSSPLAFAKRAEKVRNQDKDLKQYLKSAQNLVAGEKKKRAALKNKGIDYDFPGYAASLEQWKPKFMAKLDTKSA